MLTLKNTCMMFELFIKKKLCFYSYVSVEGLRRKVYLKSKILLSPTYIMSYKVKIKPKMRFGGFGQASGPRVIAPTAPPCLFGPALVRSTTTSSGFCNQVCGLPLCFLPPIVGSISVSISPSSVLLPKSFFNDSSAILLVQPIFQHRVSNAS